MHDAVVRFGKPPLRACIDLFPQLGKLVCIIYCRFDGCCCARALAYILPHLSKGLFPHLGEGARSAPLTGHHDIVARLVPEVVPILGLRVAPQALDL